MVFGTSKSRKRFIDKYRELVEDLDQCKDVDLNDTIQLKSNKVRVPAPEVPMQILLGGEMGQRLFLYPETVFDATGEFSNTGDYLLFDPDQFFTTIGGFLRITPGDTLVLGRDDSNQSSLLDYPDTVDTRHLQIKLSEKKLKFSDKTLKRGSCITPLPAKTEIRRLETLRRQNISRLYHLIADCLDGLSTDAAQELLDAVIEISGQDDHQPKDSKGRPGGLLEFSSDTNFVIVGDLHGKIDNLLVVLSQGHILEEIARGRATLLILGDAVHPDETGAEHDMDSSIRMMDCILRLKFQFPDHVYYIRGNHDSFSEEIAKHGVPQGILWEKTLESVRGARYVESMKRFYDILPYFVLTPQLLACHAGAPTCKISRDRLINVRQHPKLESQLATIRHQKPKALTGYNAGDVKRLRKKLDVSPETSFVVGHTPITSEETLWLNINHIPNHHVLFGAHPDWVGAFAQVGDRFLPMTFHSEPLSEMIARITAEDATPTALQAS